MGYFYNEEQNPADYLVKSLAIVPGQELESADKALNICKIFERSPYAKFVRDRIEQENGKKVRSYFYLIKKLVTSIFNSIV